MNLLRQEINFDDIKIYESTSRQQLSEYDISKKVTEETMPDSLAMEKDKENREMSIICMRQKRK